jgi:hypothetical protein
MIGGTSLKNSLFLFNWNCQIVFLPVKDARLSDFSRDTGESRKVTVVIGTLGFKNHGAL